MVYRGAVTFGEFLIDDRFWIGPAIDEAAMNEKLPRAGLVWLSQSARQVYDRAGQAGGGGLFIDGMQDAVRNTPLILDYPVPLPKDQSQAAHTVNPLARSPFDVRALIRVMLSTFTPDREDILCKRKNTEAFLLHAAEPAEKDELRVALAARRSGGKI